MNRRGDISVAQALETVAVTALIVLAWFACAGLLGVFIGCVWRVAKWMQQ